MGGNEKGGRILEAMKGGRIMGGNRREDIGGNEKGGRGGNRKGGNGRERE